MPVVGAFLRSGASSADRLPGVTRAPGATVTGSPPRTEWGPRGVRGAPGVKGPSGCPPRMITPLGVPQGGEPTVAIIDAQAGPDCATANPAACPPRRRASLEGHEVSPLCN